MKNTVRQGNFLIDMTTVEQGQPGEVSSNEMVV